jgi:hypothetical protein
MYVPSPQPDVDGIQVLGGCSPDVKKPSIERSFSSERPDAVEFFVKRAEPAGGTASSARPETENGGDNMLCLDTLHGKAPAARLTFLDLARMEPRLSDLLGEARAVRDDGESFFCADLASIPFRRRLRGLAGFLRGDDGPAELFSTEAYDLASEALFHALPSCRGRCGCGRSR